MRLSLCSALADDPPPALTPAECNALSALSQKHRHGTAPAPKAQSSSENYTVFARDSPEQHSEGDRQLLSCEWTAVSSDAAQLYMPDRFSVIAKGDTIKGCGKLRGVFCLAAGSAKSD